MQIAASLWDEESDRAIREPRRPVPPATVAVVDGPFLLRRETADAFDLPVHLQTSPAAVTRRDPGVLASWQHYLAQAEPDTRAQLVVRHDDPRHPANVRR